MATYTITTTPDQETALAEAYARSQNIVPPAPEAPASQEAYLQQQVNTNVLNPMVGTYALEANTVLMHSLATIPVENRAAALTDLEAAVTDNGGTLPPGDGELSSGVFVQPFTVRPAIPPPPPPLPLPPAGKIPPDSTTRDRLR